MNAAQNRTLLLAPLSLLVLVSAACSKENKIDQSQRNSYVIDPSTSAILPGPDGLDLQVTQGAVASQVTIEMNEADPGAYTPVPAGMMVAGKVYGFEPHNMTFQHPVKIHLPIVSGANGVITSEPGGSWSPVQSAPAGLSMEVQTDHFSFYAVTAGGGPNGDVPDTGTTMPPGRDASAGSSEDAGGGALTGTGGGGKMCTDPGPQPSGSTDASGSLGHMLVPTTGVPFAAKDGYAVYTQTSMTGGLSTTYHTMLQLTFTDYPSACYTALATGQGSQGGIRGGKANSKVFQTSLEWDSMTGKFDVVPGTYDAMTKDLRFDAGFYGLTGSCQPEQAHVQPNDTSTITVTMIDATHVEGMVTINGNNGAGPPDTFTGSFNLPICNLPEQPFGMCCLP